MLQIFAYNCQLQKEPLKVVFVSEHGLAFNHLQDHDDYLPTVIELKELTSSAAIYLLVHRGIPFKLAETVYKTITGGLISLLLKFIEEYHQGKSYETILKERDNKLEQSLKEIGIAPNHAVFLELLLELEMGESEVADLLTTENTFTLLLKHQVLALHYCEYVYYTFANKHVETWMRIKQAERESLSGKSDY
jgi:hypothetical protein